MRRYTKCNTFSYTLTATWWGIIFYIRCIRLRVRHGLHYLHVGKLLHGREAREIEPGHVLPVFMVISLILQVSEGGATQSVKLQSVLLPILICHNINIWRNETQIDPCHTRHRCATVGVKSLLAYRPSVDTLWWSDWKCNEIQYSVWKKFTNATMRNWYAFCWAMYLCSLLCLEFVPAHHCATLECELFYFVCLVTWYGSKC